MIETFAQLYGDASGMRVFRAPGRVNLIGEHTDYNLGFVLPIALEQSCFMAAVPTHGTVSRVHSLERAETHEFDPATLADAKPRGDWTDYVVGVAQQLARRGVRISPMNMLLHSEVPEGSGLSSSAALEVSSALAFLYGRSWDKVGIARACQQAEVEFRGMPCGIMDQYVSVFGRAGKAILIDCKILEHSVVDLPKDVAIIAVNSKVRHELADSAYAERVEQCAAAVAAIQKINPNVKSLRDANLREVEFAPMDELFRRRARHIVTENARVLEFPLASQRGDLVRLGNLFVESHLSMQHDYEITCEELDFLVDVAVGIEGVYGARMTGGGFGGCTVNLVRPDAVARFTEAIVTAYKDKYGVVAPVFACVPGDGAAEINIEKYSGLTALRN